MNFFPANPEEGIYDYPKSFDGSARGSVGMPSPKVSRQKPFQPLGDFEIDTIKEDPDMNDTDVLVCGICQNVVIIMFLDNFCKFGITFSIKYSEWYNLISGR